MTVSEAQVLKEGRQRSAPRVLEIHEAIRVEGEHELSRPVTALAVSGLAAGLSMGFSFVAEASLANALPHTQWATLISKLGYAVGFLIVILGRQQLFTENTLTPILALMSRPSRAAGQRLLRLWAVVLVANLVGAMLFALFLAKAPAFDPQMNGTFARMAGKIFGMGSWATFCRAILGGWLIALMVWLLPFAETARPFVIIIVTYLVGIAHLAHIIAGSVEMFYAVFVGLAALPAALAQFALPALVGNVIGGVAFVSMLHHAQVRFDYHHKEEVEELGISLEGDPTRLQQPFPAAAGLG